MRGGSFKSLEALALLQGSMFGFSRSLRQTWPCMKLDC